MVTCAPARFEQILSVNDGSCDSVKQEIQRSGLLGWWFLKYSHDIQHLTDDFNNLINLRNKLGHRKNKKIDFRTRFQEKMSFNIRNTNTYINCILSKIV